MDIHLLLNPLPTKLIPTKQSEPLRNITTTSTTTSATTRHPFKKTSRESDESASLTSTTSGGETEGYASSNSLPPKIQKTRIQHAHNKKRANKEQLKYLDAEFLLTQFPTTIRKTDIGVHLGMSAVSVSVWFQNKRQILKAQKEANGETVIKGRGRRGDLF